MQTFLQLLAQNLHPKNYYVQPPFWLTRTLNFILSIYKYFLSLFLIKYF
jgi:hypothetical protein